MLRALCTMFLPMGATPFKDCKLIVLTTQSVVTGELIVMGDIHPRGLHYPEVVLQMVVHYGTIEGSGDSLSHQVTNSLTHQMFSG